MELTLDVRESTVAAIKEYAINKGTHLDEVTQFISKVASDAIEASLKNENVITIGLRAQTLQMLRGYSHIVGATPEDVLLENSELLSDELTKVLKNKIAQAIGVPEVQVRAPAREVVTIQRNMIDTTGITDGLGDEDLDLDPVAPEPDHDPEANVPKQGGLTDKDIEEDMDIDDPNAEAKADASNFGEILAKQSTVGDGTDLFAEVAGFDSDDYVDPRIAKRKKGPTKSKGRVRSLTESVEREGEA